MRQQYYGLKKYFREHKLRFYRVLPATDARILVTSWQRDAVIAVTSFYILLYEDRCLRRPYGPQGAVFTGEYQFFMTVRLPPYIPIAPTTWTFDKARARSTPHIARSSKSYPLALKAAHHLIAVIFHRALQEGYKIQSHPLGHRFPIQRRVGRITI